MWILVDSSKALHGYDTQPRLGRVWTGIAWVWQLWHWVSTTRRYFSRLKRTSWKIFQWATTGVKFASHTELMSSKQILHIFLISLFFSSQLPKSWMGKWVRNIRCCGENYTCVDEIFTFKIIRLVDFFPINGLDFIAQLFYFYGAKTKQKAIIISIEILLSFHFIHLYYNEVHF